MDLATAGSGGVRQQERAACCKNAHGEGRGGGEAQRQQTTAAAAACATFWQVTTVASKTNVNRKMVWFLTHGVVQGPWASKKNLDNSVCEEALAFEAAADEVCGMFTRISIFHLPCTFNRPRVLGDA